LIHVLQLGTLDYEAALRLQASLVEMRKAGRVGDVLLLLEHPPVITLGRNANAANILASSKKLGAAGVQVFECNRGGDVTFHGPGQLVGYPIFDLRGFLATQRPRKTLGAVDFVRRLEEILIRSCADFGIATECVRALTGVWTKASNEGAPAKIAAIGVHISRGVTSHGFALNVNTDLEYFNLIIPCGITKEVTSAAKELGTRLLLDDVAQSIARNFGEVFQREIVFVHTLEQLLGWSMGIPMKPPAELRALHEDELFWA